MANIIIPSGIATIGQIVMIDGVCYEITQKTPAPTTHSSVDGVYASCAACEEDIPFEILACSDDSVIGYDEYENMPTDKYFWVCDSSIWVKAKRGVLSPGETPAAWSYLEQCGTTPTECADLVGWVAGDLLDGVGCASAVAEDTNWNIIWSKIDGGGTTSIASSKMHVVMNAVNGASETWQNNVVLDGDFELVQKIEFITFSTDVLISQAAAMRLLDSSGSVAQVTMNKTGQSNQSDEWVIGYDGASGNTILDESWEKDYVWIRAQRSGATITFDYSSDGSSWTAVGVSTTNSNTIIYRVCTFSRWTGGNLTVDHDNFSIEDGSGNDLLIDPSGAACP